MLLLASRAEARVLGWASEWPASQLCSTHRCRRRSWLTADCNRSACSSEAEDRADAAATPGNMIFVMTRLDADDALPRNAISRIQIEATRQMEGVHDTTDRRHFPRFVCWKRFLMWDASNASALGHASP
eukprot:4155246-Prymnesium_polylepis.1